MNQEEQMHDIELVVDDKEEDPTSRYGLKTEHSTKMGTDTELDFENGNFLQIEGAGIQGFLEKLPLSFKLGNMIAVALLGFIAIGVFLIGVQAPRLRIARVGRKTQDVLSSVASYIEDLRAEREASNTYYAYRALGVVPSNVTDALFASFEKTRISQKKLYRLLDKYNLRDNSLLAGGIAKLEEVTQKLPVVHELTLNGQLDAVTGFIAYNGLVGNVLLLLDNFGLLSTNNGLVANYATFNRIIELEHQLKSVGVIAGAQTKTTYGVLRGFIKFSGQRDYLVDYWLQSSSKRLRIYYNSVMDVGLVTSLKIMFEDLVSSSRFYLIPDPLINGTSVELYLPSSFSLEDWNILAMEKIQILEKINKEIEIEMKEVVSKDLKISSILIVFVLLVIAVAFTITTLVAGCTVRTIVGPWKRLNFVQAQSIQKFVPKTMLQLFGVQRIEDAVLGLTKKKDLTLLVVQGTLDNISNISNIVEINRGFIYEYKQDGALAFFVRTTDAVKAANLILSCTRCQVGIHRGTFEICTLGDDKHIQCAIVGSQQHIATKISNLITKYKIPLLATSTIRKNLYSDRIWCWIGSDDGQDFYSIVNDESQQDVSKAIKMFHDKNYIEAITILGELHRRCSENIIVDEYLRRSIDHLKIRSLFKIKATIEDIAKLPSVYQALVEYAVDVDSYMLRLWTAIGEYQTLVGTERLLKAQEIYNFCLDEDLQIPKDLLNELSTSLSSGNSDLFADLKEYISWTIDDLLSRYKETDSFKEVFQQSRLELENFQL